MIKVAILDDDPVMLEVLSKLLEAGGYECQCFERGRQLIRSLHDKGFDLFLLDWNVPDLSGISVLGWIRNQIGATPPVLLLTSRSSEEDVVSGLLGGADDFVTKPFQPAALMARIESLLRRTTPVQQAKQAIETFGIYSFDLIAKVVRFAGQSVHLNPKEFSLAIMLFRSRNRAITRAQIFETIWGINANDSTRTLDVHVSRIKAKLELKAGNGFCITTVYGYGYRLEEVL